MRDKAIRKFEKRMDQELEITGISAADLMDRKLVEMYGKTGS